MQRAAGRHSFQSCSLSNKHNSLWNIRQHVSIYHSLSTALASQKVVHGHVYAGSVRRRPFTQVPALGPEPYAGGSGGGQPSRRVRKPEWVRILEEDADNDPEVARLLEGTDGDPDQIREKMKFALKETDMRREQQGSDVPPVIKFRAISPMGLWVWLEFLEAPLSGEQELLEGILKSWFAVGKLGGYNSQNLQVYQNADDDQSFFEYDNDELEAGETRMASYVHDIGEVEYQGNWARVWIDMGTADELALDVLINTLVGFSTEMCGLKSVLLGGSNEDWPVPDEEPEFGPDNDYMKVGMDPMRLPEGLDEEFQFMDDEGMLEGGKGRRPAASRGEAAYSSAGSGSASGYSIRGGQYGAKAEEQELQRLAERLRRPAGAPGGGRAARTRRGGGGSAAGGYYGADGDRDLDLDLDLGPDFDPDELEFTDADEGEAGDNGGRAGAGAGGQMQHGTGLDVKRPWGASFVRRVRRDGNGAGGGGGSGSARE
ncbi:hypothetical protein Vretimale_1838 [Volvox reticuliferus]|uniref:Uncharacterized protein n=1 Tax=Volvox reticuliferus TaxID=1737510 RepID=A0A8J4CVJ2_9CHLO|nr:hypothetical protein Vretifemale_17319 [Volvox reticuliferus]GIL95924.1 hypothetical protein Vretimale_1838 [Volvox reticuliferus]